MMSGEHFPQFQRDRYLRPIPIGLLLGGMAEISARNSLCKAMTQLHQA